MVKLKKEFRQRLIKLNISITKVLENDVSGDVKTGDLFPCLYKAFAYLWTDYKAFKK